jgi:hypothetical protein
MSTEGSSIKVYTPQWYRENQKLQDSDEAYGFTTKVFMHPGYGIRCEYHIHESYLGDREYKLGKVFVITLENEILDLLGCDFDERIVMTQKGAIPFNLLKLEVEERD